MAQRYNVTLETAAGVIAALSPNNRWERNLIDADSMIRAYSIGGHNAADSIKLAPITPIKLRRLKFYPVMIACKY
jgi:hypothetical protein